MLTIASIFPSTLTGWAVFILGITVLVLAYLAFFSRSREDMYQCQEILNVMNDGKEWRRVDIAEKCPSLDAYNIGFLLDALCWRGSIAAVGKETEQRVGWKTFVITDIGRKELAEYNLALPPRNQ